MSVFSNMCLVTQLFQFKNLNISLFHNYSTQMKVSSFHFFEIYHTHFSPFTIQMLHLTKTIQHILFEYTI